MLKDRTICMYHQTQSSVSQVFTYREERSMVENKMQDSYHKEKLIVELVLSCSYVGLGILVLGAQPCSWGSFFSPARQNKVPGNNLFSCRSSNAVALGSCPHLVLWSWQHSISWEGRRLDPCHLQLWFLHAGGEMGQWREKIPVSDLLIKLFLKHISSHMVAYRSMSVASCCYVTVSQQLYWQYRL